MPIIYHVTTAAEWNAAKAIGAYESPSLKAEGFIHCSRASQVMRIANEFYRELPSIVLLVINAEKVKSSLKWEPGTDKPDELFPHVFGVINLNAVDSVVQLQRNGNGEYYLPAEIGELE